jgi:hypothetical protein
MSTTQKVFTNPNSGDVVHMVMLLVRNKYGRQKYCEPCSRTPDMSDSNSKLLILSHEHPDVPEHVPDLDSKPQYKYYSRGKNVINRKILYLRSGPNDTADLLVQRLQEYEIVYGLYKDNAGVNLPEHVMALYGTFNPRSTKKATIATIKHLIDVISSAPKDEDNICKLDSVIKTEIHRSCKQTIFLDIDIDTKDPEIYTKLMGLLQREKICPHVVIETHGGYHVMICLLNLTKNQKMFLYNKLMREIDSKLVEFNNGNQCPIPGTIQGGFKVRMLAEGMRATC